MAPLVAVGVAWGTLAGLAAAAGLVVRPAGEPPLRIGLAAGAPVLLVLGLLAVPRFRAWVRRLDPQPLVTMQGWRVAGFAFLVLYAQGLLPGGFAWAAGLGDLAIGLTAPFVARHLARRGAAAWPVFLAWTVAGIADFVLAVGLGMAHSLTVVPPSGAAPMAELPLSLVPTFAVPFLLVVHVLALVRVRELRSAATRPG